MMKTRRITSIVIVVLFIFSLSVLLSAHAQTSSTDCTSCHPKYPSDSFDKYLDTNQVPKTNCLPCHGGLDGHAAAVTETPYGWFETTESINFANPVTKNKIHTQHKATLTSLPDSYGCYVCHAGARCTACHSPSVPHGNHTVKSDGTNSYPGVTERYAQGRDKPSIKTTLNCTNAKCHGSMNLIYVARPSCTNCHAHEKDWYLTPHGYDSALHAATNAGVGCTDCHATDLKTEHDKPSSKTSTGGSITCSTCHPNYVNLVKPWDQSCNAACHPKGQHTEQTAKHQTTTTENCADCHSPDISTVHAAKGCLISGCHTQSSVPSKRDCVQCHTDPIYLGPHGYKPELHMATNAGVGCTDCHATELKTEHDKISSQTSTGASITCSTCHVGSPSYVSLVKPWNKSCNLLCHPKGQHTEEIAKHLSTTVGCDPCHSKDVKAVHAAKGCLISGCHSATAVPTTTDCNMCHTPYHKNLPAKHTGTNAENSDCPDKGCTNCHSIDLEAEHFKPTSVTSMGGLLTCFTCHSYYTNLVKPWNYTCNTICHPNGLHHAKAAKHQTTTTENCASTGCHNPDISVVHAAKGCYISGCHIQCSVPWKKDCVQCHTDPKYLEPHGYPPEKHQATSAGVGCTDCHATELKPEHDKLSSQTSSGESITCATCHPKYVNLVTPWNKSCNLVCHPKGQHTEETTKHKSTTAGCSQCHSTDVKAVHAAKGCLITGCHSATAVPTTTDCNVCHPSTPTHQVTGEHNSINCSKCHVSDTSPSVTTKAYADQALWIQNLASSTTKDGSGSPTNITTTFKDNQYVTAYTVQAGASSKVVTMKLNQEANKYSQVILRIYINSFNSSGANVRIYAYNSDGDTLNISSYVGTKVNKTGWKDFDVTTLAQKMSGYGWMKFRVTTTDNSFTVSEGEFSLTTLGPLVEEAICYQCHNNPANSKNGINIQQLFTVGTATWTGQSSKGYYTKVNTRHDISDSDQAWSGTKIECTNCHNAHLASRTYMLINPDSKWTQWTQMRNDPRQGLVNDSIGFCLKCHDNTWAADGSVKAPTAILNIAAAYTDNDQHGDAEGNRNSGYFQGYFQKYPRMLCTDCHDPHGSGGVYHLKTLTDQYGTPITITNPDAHEVVHWCSHCHDNPMNHLDSENKTGCISRSCHLHGTSSF